MPLASMTSNSQLRPGESLRRALERNMIDTDALRVVPVEMQSDKVKQVWSPSLGLWGAGVA